MKGSKTFCEKNAGVVLLNLRKDWGYLSGEEINALSAVRVWSAVRDVSMRMLVCGEDDASNSVIDTICDSLGGGYEFSGYRDADFYGRVVRFCVAVSIFLSFSGDGRQKFFMKMANEFFWECIDCFYGNKEKFLHESDNWADLREFVFLGGVSSYLSGDKDSSALMASRVVFDLDGGGKDYEFFEAFSGFVIEGLDPSYYIEKWRGGVLNGDTNLMPAPYVMLLKILANSKNNGTRTNNRTRTN